METLSMMQALDRMKDAPEGSSLEVRGIDDIELFRAHVEEASRTLALSVRTSWEGNTATLAVESSHPAPDVSPLV